MQLDSEDQDILRQEVGAFRDRLSSPHAKPTYERLLQAVEAAEIPDEMLEALGRVLELSIGTGRLRKIHGAHAVMAMKRIFDKTPQALAVKATVDEVNEALAALAGQTIEKLTFAPADPGGFTLLINTDQCQARLAIGPAGLQIRSLEVGA